MRFLRESETSFRPTGDHSFEIENTLPPGNYLLKQDLMGFYFDKVSDFNITTKVYGNPLKRTDRIINTFLERPFSTGVLLYGEKGSGKTMESKLLAEKMAGLNYATVIINDPYCGDAFNQLVQGMNQPCMFLFDEFEKVYPRDRQEAILTLLDGVFPTKKLFVFTCNDKYRIDAHMHNRPGRIFYAIEYKGLEAQFVREYCQDNLDNKAYVEDVVKLFHLFDSLNFDILKALVEEMNRYKENVQEAMVMLNAQTHSSSRSTYKVEVYKDRVKLPDGAFYPSQLDSNPAGQDWGISLQMPSIDVNDYPDMSLEEITAAVALKYENSDWDDDEDYDDAISIDSSCKKRVLSDGTMVFKVSNGYEVRCVKKFMVHSFNDFFNEEYD